MPDQNPSDTLLSFEKVLIQERAAIRPDDAPGKPASPFSALCISGGGIRSATFALGAIQGLANHRVLEKFDYLSTVSGGGYIGSWLTAWKQRRNGLAGVIPELNPSAPTPSPASPDPIRHLREYNSYLSPKLGLFSIDTWTLVATVARNMFLNWLVLVPLLMFALMLPRLVLSVAKLGDTYTLYGHWMIDLRRVLEYGLPIASGVLLAIGVCNALRYLPGVGGENRPQGHFLRWVLAPLVTAAVAFIAMDSWFTGGDATVKAVSQSKLRYLPLLAWTVGSIFLGWLLWLVDFLRRAEYRKQKFSELKNKSGLWFAGMLIALALTGFTTASGAWLLTEKLFLHLPWPVYVTVAGPLLMLSFGLAGVLFVGMAGAELKDEDREWLSRAGAWWLLIVLVWTGMSVLVLQAPDWLVKLPGWMRSAFAGAGGLGAVVTALGGLRGKTKPEQKDGSQQKSSLTATLLDLALKLAAAVFVIVFLAGLALLTNILLLKIGVFITRLHESHEAFVTQDWWNHGPLAENTPVELVAIFAVGFLVFGWIMAWLININRFSLHAMYRDRLIRAYLGASNQKPDFNKFTGFDETDNLLMSKISAGLRPFHVVNTTLNLVAGKRLDWQQRKAEPFTVSALHCGSHDLGYRPANQYGGKEGISLGTAMTLSGAAASPNMGYYSSPVFGFIMTLLNARLGAWLGNPGPCGSSTWRKEGPNSAVESLVREAFGLTDETCPYVYLSDGGHFENLGIYEMVKRGCRYLIVIDGAADGELKFGDLGNALRKIRIDTKVDIKFQEGWEQDLSKRDKRWATATICYRAAGLGEDGYLIYIKPLMCGTEPPDVVAYQSVNSDFPHQSTANQFFNESQTESYRMLGFVTVDEMCEGWEASEGFSGLVKHVRNKKLKKPEIAAAASAGQKS